MNFPAVAPINKGLSAARPGGDAAGREKKDRRSLGLSRQPLFKLIRVPTNRLSQESAPPAPGADKLFCNPPAGAVPRAPYLLSKFTALELDKSFGLSGRPAIYPRRRARGQQ